MNRSERRDWIPVGGGGVLFLLGVLVCSVLVAGSLRKVRVLGQLTDQLGHMGTLQARLEGVERGLETLAGAAVAQDAVVPRARISEILIGEAFALQPETEPLAPGWERQSLRLTSHSLSASKWLALLPELCGREHRYRLAELTLRALPGQRGLVEVDARFERLAVVRLQPSVSR